MSPGYNHRDFPPAHARCAYCGAPVTEDGRYRGGWRHDDDEPRTHAGRPEKVST